MSEDTPFYRLGSARYHTASGLSRALLKLSIDRLTDEGLLDYMEYLEVARGLAEGWRWSGDVYQELLSRIVEAKRELYSRSRTLG